MTEAQYQAQLKKLREAKQGGSPSSATPSASIVSNPQPGFGSSPDDGGFSVVEPSAQASMNIASPFEEFLDNPIPMLKEDERVKRESSIPEWETGQSGVDFVGNNLVNPIVQPLEQWGRLFPAIAYEGKRMFDVATLGDPTASKSADEYEKFQAKIAKTQKENPFVPGIEQLSGLDAAALVGQRTIKAMFDVATLGKGSSVLKGGKIALKQIPKIAAEGALLGAGQSMTGTEGAKVGDVATGAGVGAVLNPAAQVAMRGASQLVRKLLGRPEQEALEQATTQAIGETALVKTPTPFELAEQRFKMRNMTDQAKDLTGEMPLGTKNPVTGAIEVPEGGFSPFTPTGYRANREPMEGFVMDDMNEATKMLESVLGKKKTSQLKKTYIEGLIQEPQPDPSRILLTPEGMRPAPVLGKYAIERPYVTDLPDEIQQIISVGNKIDEDVIPKHIPTSIKNIPIEKRDPSTLQVLARNMWQPMQSTISKFGKSGQQLSKKIDDFRAQEYNYRGKVQNNMIDKAFGKLKLTDEESTNFWEAAQGQATPMNEKVANAVNESQKLANFFFKENTDRGITDNMVDNTGSPLIEPDKYLSHMFNEQGWRQHEFDTNKFFKTIAQHNMKPGDDIDEMTNEVMADWKYIQQNLTPKSFFERKRTWRIPPEWLERDPMKIWSRYNASASKRYALLDHFGEVFEDADDVAGGQRKLNYPGIKQFIGQIGQESGTDAMRYADNAMELIVGRGPTDFKMGKIAADITEFQLISKLTPLTTISNINQGFAGSINQHGFKYGLQGLKDAFSKEGAEWTRKTGLTGEGFHTPSRNTKSLKIWGKITGFPWSEDFNFRVATNSAKHFLLDSYQKLQANPNNKELIKQFELHGLDAKQLLEQGRITDDDLLKGSFIMARDTIFPRLVEQATSWSNNPMGKLIYQFAHYGLKQPAMLAKQFKVSKKRGTASLMKYLATQAAFGEVTADIWELIKEGDLEGRPKGAARVADNILSSGSAGIPYQILKGMSSGFAGLGGMFGGPTMGGLLNTGSRVINDLEAGDPMKAGEDLIRARVRGDIPFGGPPIPAGSMIERMIPREALERKKKEGGSYKKMGGFDGAKSFQSY